MGTLSISVNTTAIAGKATGGQPVERNQGVSSVQQSDKSSDRSNVPASAQGVEKTLTPEAQRQIASLQQIDRNVRAHEQAHISAGRDVITSTANFSYTYGPDGKQYAVGGEVGIDTSAEKTPEANIDKGMRIQAAALAPRDPSSQDYRVAAIGTQLEAQGRVDLSQQQRETNVSASHSVRQRVEQAYLTSEPQTSLSTFA
jgi:hypothetical protein